MNYFSPPVFLLIPKIIQLAISLLAVYYPISSTKGPDIILWNPYIQK